MKRTIKVEVEVGGDQVSHLTDDDDHELGVLLGRAGESLRAFLVSEQRRGWLPGKSIEITNVEVL